jgi:hypothetical protein
MSIENILYSGEAGLGLRVAVWELTYQLKAVSRGK